MPIWKMTNQALGPAQGKGPFWNGSDICVFEPLSPVTWCLLPLVRAPSARPTPAELPEPRQPLEVVGVCPRAATLTLAASTLHQPVIILT
jgi:hypothetical protein